ncbi:hypothetical protein OCU04_010998 [Sclerotinia nivalis]|uniref:Uncharacterized protein n=1 Tax=Sclerotinia nivalis TaxID=352851 RepID=A0A9X0DH81_9HELO|nr:hypothetical protein OCU04_010998 [Sclerotinia nivalis]
MLISDYMMEYGALEFRRLPTLLEHWSFEGSQCSWSIGALKAPRAPKYENLYKQNEFLYL